MNQTNRWILLGLSLFFTFSLLAQETFPINDVKDKRWKAYAFVNAIIHLNPDESINGGTMLIREGKILAVGKDISIPPGFQKIDLQDKHVYPSFIDLHSHYGMPAVKPASGRGFSGAEKISPQTKGAYNANDGIKSHYHAHASFVPLDKKANGLRKIGFGSVLAHRPDGFARGTSALVTLGNTSPNREIIKAEAAAHYSFERGSSTQSYPRSTMGYVSLLRQTYLDAEWYHAQDPPPFADAALQGWIDNQQLPQIFTTRSWINALRADRIGDEFGKQYIIKGGGDAYQRIDEIKKTQASLIIPINFPDPYDVEDPLDAEKVSLRDMLHWELAPTNAATLEKNGIEFAITRDGLKKDAQFFQNIRTAIRHGLTAERALASLTITPAKILGVSNRLGQLIPGALANFLVTDGEIFAEKTKIHQNWIQGNLFEFQSLSEEDRSGKYSLTIAEDQYDIEIKGKGNNPTMTLILDDSTKAKIKGTFSKSLWSGHFALPPGNKTYRLSGWKSDGAWSGTGQDTTGQWFSWTLLRQGNLGGNEENKSKKEKETIESKSIGDVVYPFLAYGVEQMPKAQKILFSNATVWTNEAKGILPNTDVLIADGKIIEIGKDLRSNDALVIDATGKHLTAGIIDEHTHIAGGGNDVLTNSAMVRIGDQVNSEDINIYRALAGGVTAAQVLHGSANPIGGQSAIIKMRWGSAPEALKVSHAPEFIKFALGENVKRSRNAQSVRYPQTRMGVEQVFVDAFSNARTYENTWKAYDVLSSTEKASAVRPRRDLAMDAILEILNGERFITCHSYVQSEINMLMHVADQFDFTVNTFTHIMEGYKLADKMRDHGAGGSSFSDWFNYKWEVRYAIPYNATIMHNEGVLTAINSDDANMGRRLNQEAAKSVKYGNMSEEDALKLVTLNPAKMLHLEDQMGSIKEGKDADVVLWSDHPLSIYAKAEKTLVDGKIYFDIAVHEENRKRLAEERNRLIQKMVAAKKSGKPTQKAGSALNMLIHCESVLGEESHHQH